MTRREMDTACEGKRAREGLEHLWDRECSHRARLQDGGRKDSFRILLTEGSKALIRQWKGVI